jgi:hypothetical protein
MATKGSDEKLLLVTALERNPVAQAISSSG